MDRYRSIQAAKASFTPKLARDGLSLSKMMAKNNYIFTGYPGLLEMMVWYRRII